MSLNKLWNETMLQLNNFALYNNITRIGCQVIMKYYESEIAKKNLWTLVGNAGHSGRSG
jgi:hypothetical protein